MTATSATGRGQGAAHTLTVSELSAITKPPMIFAAGYADAVDGMASPPETPGNIVVFPSPLSGRASEYTVILTTQNGGSAYVTAMNENDDDEFIGFTFLAESECTMMYMVVKNGFRPA